MAILFEIYLAFLRIFMLTSTVILTFFFGTTALVKINQFLHASYFPCLEIISFLIALIPPLMIFYGIKGKKYFWQKPSQSNIIIFGISFIIGVIVSFIPSEALAFLNPASLYCIPPTQPFDIIMHIVGSGLIATLFAFIGVDIGVSLKHVSGKMVSPHNKSSSKKRRKG